MANPWEPADGSYPPDPPSYGETGYDPWEEMRRAMAKSAKELADHSIEAMVKQVEAMSGVWNSRESAPFFSDRARRARRLKRYVGDVPRKVDVSGIYDQVQNHYPTSDQAAKGWRRRR